MSLIKNSTYNALGFIIPTLIAIPALGVLARQLGLESFGLFTLAFAIVGYASIFDGGITRAVVREIAMYRHNEAEQNKIISTASVMIIFLSLFAMLLLYFGATNLVNLLKVSSQNAIQAKVVFQLLAAVIPIFLINQIWLAFLEGHENFININMQKVISNSVIAILPVLFCLYENTLISAVLGLVVGRIISFFITFFVCKDMILSSGLHFDKHVFRRFVSFGGWLTVSNIISPIMVYFDRFVISNIMGASKIAFYTAPAEAIYRLTNIPYALGRALFPKLSYEKDTDEKKRLEKISYLLITIVCLPIVVVGYFFGEYALILWLGESFSGITVVVFKILLVGFYFNALAQIPYSVLQANGKSKTTAIVHIFEIIPYLGLLIFLTHEFGIIGTAIAWSVRMIVDFIILYFLGVVEKRESIRTLA